MVSPEAEHGTGWPDPRLQPARPEKTIADPIELPAIAAAMVDQAGAEAAAAVASCSERFGPGRPRRDGNEAVASVLQHLPQGSGPRCHPAASGRPSWPAPRPQPAAPPTRRNRGCAQRGPGAFASDDTTCSARPSLTAPRRSAPSRPS